MLRSRTSIVLFFPLALLAQDHDATLLGTGYLNVQVGQGHFGYGVQATGTAIHVTGASYDE
ncbi:MAG: hypothetical protein JNL43_08045 [Flavobacteriales bacterium]|nr:hypothetical protein [Flavobacteriales bacterium]